MIACLRSSRFMYPDRSRSVFIELRRRNGQFVVTRRTTHPNVMIHKEFAVIREAREFWRGEAVKLEDAGLIRLDMHIAGFHEED